MRVSTESERRDLSQRADQPDQHQDQNSVRYPLTGSLTTSKVGDSVRACATSWMLPRWRYHPPEFGRLLVVAEQLEHADRLRFLIDQTARVETLKLRRADTIILQRD